MINYEALFDGEQVCCTCSHFVQHYRKSGLDQAGKFEPIGCGHCLKRPSKRLPPETHGCDRWEKREP